MLELPSDRGITQFSGPDDVEISSINWSNVNRVEQTRSALVSNAFRQKLTSGHLGIYALCNGEVVGHVWADPSGSQVVRAWGGVDYGPDEALLTWGWVSPAQRRRGIFLALISQISMNVRESYPGSRILGDVPIDSIGSLRAHRRVGYNLYGQLDYTTFVRRLIRREFKPLEDEYAQVIIEGNKP